MCTGDGIRILIVVLAMSAAAQNTNTFHPEAMSVRSLRTQQSGYRDRASHKQL